MNDKKASIIVNVKYITGTGLSSVACVQTKRTISDCMKLKEAGRMQLSKKKVRLIKAINLMLLVTMFFLSDTVTGKSDLLLVIVLLYSILDTPVDSKK